MFCAVLAWSRVWIVRLARDERAATTLALLAECFETLGGVPRVVLADRMGCLKGGVVAIVVIPSPDYVRFASHYRFRPDFCEAHDPDSKGIVEYWVKYSKSDLMVPLLRQVSSHAAGFHHEQAGDLDQLNVAAAHWCAEVNGQVHSQVCAVPAERLAQTEQELLGPLPSLRPAVGRRELRQVDKLSTVPFASASPLGPEPDARPSRVSRRCAPSARELRSRPQ